jgi:hypothetical protein
MADRVIFLSWGESVAGREERGLEIFNEAVGFYGRMQQEGRIESFDVVLLTPNAGIEGYMELHGSAQQLNDLREDPEYLRLLMAAGTIVHDLNVVEGYTGTGVAQMMELYQGVIAGSPQPS